MPWKTKRLEVQRYELVRAMRLGEESVVVLCQRLGVSRKTAYKWRRRFRLEQLAGLRDRSPRPRRVWRRTSACWLRRLRRLRRRRPGWGARKLVFWLRRRFGEGGFSVATATRWLRRWGLTRSPRRRRRGPVVLRQAVRGARGCNDVWTVDFKGWYRTGDGRRMEPLTVRDLHSRYGLCIVLLARTNVRLTRREFVKIFKEYGLPRRIRCDNGTPFGGGGPTGLTRLSAWWVRLGIAVEFITPGRPCENGAHEQFHRVYKAEVAKDPAWDRAAQQKRSQCWLRHYNWERPHEALGMKVPGEIYRKSRRTWPAALPEWDYPRGWSKRRVMGNGEISWRGRRRYVGEAFINEEVGLRPTVEGAWWVYYGDVLVGELQEAEKGSVRMARYQRAR